MKLKLGLTVCDKRFPDRSGFLIGIYPSGFCRFRDKSSKQVYHTHQKNLTRPFTLKSAQARAQKAIDKQQLLLSQIPKHLLQHVQNLATANGVQPIFVWNTIKSEISA